MPPRVLISEWSLDGKTEIKRFSDDPISFSSLPGAKLTHYRCSWCNTPIPVNNIFIHRLTLVQRIMGGFADYQGYWCPVCGDPWKRCERIPPKGGEKSDYAENGF